MLQNKESISRGEMLESFAFIMEFPKRFQNLNVLQPRKEIDYVEIFNKGKRRIVCKDENYTNIILSHSEIDRKQRKLLVDRGFTQLFQYFLGTEDKPALFKRLNIDFQEALSTNNKNIFVCNSKLDSIIATGDIISNDLWMVCIDIGRADGEGLIEPMTWNVFTNHDITNWLSFLKSQISIRLVDEKAMPAIRLPNKPNKQRSEDVSKDTMEALGVYCMNNNKAEILICPKRIKEYAEKDKIDPENLFFIVYLHELAHAALDSCIIVTEEKTNNDREYGIKLSGQSLETNSFEPAFAMEESLANAIMLHYLYLNKKNDSQLYNDAHRFVQSQIEEYSFGISQFEVNVDWTKWREYKSKHQVPDEKLNEWYTACFEDNVPYTQELFNKVFSEDQKAAQ